MSKTWRDTQCDCQIYEVSGVDEVDGWRVAAEFLVPGALWVSLARATLVAECMPPQYSRPTGVYGVTVNSNPQMLLTGNELLFYKGKPVFFLHPTALKTSVRAKLWHLPLLMDANGLLLDADEQMMQDNYVTLSVIPELVAIQEAKINGNVATCVLLPDMLPHGRMALASSILDWAGVVLNVVMMIVNGKAGNYQGAFKNGKAATEQFWAFFKGRYDRARTRNQAAAIALDQYAQVRSQSLVVQADMYARVPVMYQQLLKQIEKTGQQVQLQQANSYQPVLKNYCSMYPAQCEVFSFSDTQSMLALKLGMDYATASRIVQEAATRYQQGQMTAAEALRWGFTTSSEVAAANAKAAVQASENKALLGKVAAGAALLFFIL